jgi:hypothetical protein
MSRFLRLDFLEYSPGGIMTPSAISKLVESRKSMNSILTHVEQEHRVPVSTEPGASKLYAKTLASLIEVLFLILSVLGTALLYAIPACTEQRFHCEAPTRAASLAWHTITTEILSCAEARSSYFVGQHSRQ